MQKKFFRINWQIQAKTLRVIGADGKQIGILPIEKAIKLGQEQDFDLVEIAPTANPPVARLVNFKKFKFEQERKERKAVKKIKAVETKEVRVGPFISDHDLQTKISQAKNFLLQGDNFKLTIQFKPRQMRHTEFGNKVVEKVKENLESIAEVLRDAKWEGRRLSIIFSKTVHGKSQKR